MDLNAGEKWLKNVLLAYLILAIIGSFAFAAGQAFSYEKSDRDFLGSNSYFSSIVHTIDWLAEDTPAISNAYKNSNSPLRNGLLRVFTLAGITGITVFLAKSNFKININENFPVIKNLFPLKLRI